MAGLGTTALAGARYKLHSSAWDAESNCALFFSTFIAAHTGDGGPVAPTGKETNSHYVYVIKMKMQGRWRMSRKFGIPAGRCANWVGPNRKIEPIFLLFWA
ncbi:hypothetical protein N9P27_01050 [bacterium]|nr:hypothetical protein [bacterium]